MIWCSLFCGLVLSGRRPVEKLCQVTQLEERRTTGMRTNAPRRRFSANWQHFSCPSLFIQSEDRHYSKQIIYLTLRQTETETVFKKIESAIRRTTRSNLTYRLLELVVVTSPVLLG